MDKKEIVEDRRRMIDKIKEEYQAMVGYYG
jgi:hypothetical protein